MAVHSVRIANVVIGQVALAPEALRQRALSARLEPPTRIRHRNRKLVDETLGFSLVTADGRRIGRTTGLIDRSTPELGEQWEVTALLDEPSYRPPRVGDGTA